jgi:hypothetical protein
MYIYEVVPIGSVAASAAAYFLLKKESAMKITVSTNEGEVIEVIDLSDADLQKAFAKAWFMDQIVEAVNRGRHYEEKKEGH